MPKISIVIPAYNVGDYLQECLIQYGIRLSPISKRLS